MQPQSFWISGPREGVGEKLILWQGCCLRSVTVHSPTKKVFVLNCNEVTGQTQEKLINHCKKKMQYFKLNIMNYVYSFMLLIDICCEVTTACVFIKGFNTKW